MKCTFSIFAVLALPLVASAHGYNGARFFQRRAFVYQRPVIVQQVPVVVQQPVIQAPVYDDGCASQGVQLAPGYAGGYATAGFAPVGYSGGFGAVRGVGYGYGASRFLIARRAFFNRGFAFNRLAFNRGFVGGARFVGRGVAVRAAGVRVAVAGRGFVGRRLR